MVKRAHTTTLGSSSSRNFLPDQTIDDTEQIRLLHLLNSHGQSFLNSFELPVPKSTVPKPSKRKRKLQELEDRDSTEDASNKAAISASEDSAPSSTSISTSPVPDVVVFDARVGTSSQPLVRGNGKGFMSSKIHQVREDPQPRQAKTEDSDGESDEETSNARNDKLLHELVHSQLLSNPHAFDAKQGSAKRSRIVAGRLLELADDAKLGQGATALKEREKARHAQRVRLGLRDKAKQREAKALEEAKSLGNYHLSIKRNFSSGAAKQRRERGLALGIGKFRNGALTISKSDLRSIEGALPTGASRKGKGSKRH